MFQQAIAYYVEGTTFIAAGGKFLHETMPVEIRTTRNSTADDRTAFKDFVCFL